MIFISYRQASASAYAGRLYERLKRHFGGQVFRDVDEIQPGDDWVESLDRAVATSQALVALIGADWTEERDARGRRRLESESDWMRVEVAAALRRKIPVFAVLLPGAATLMREELPDDIKALADSESHQLSAGGWATEVEAFIRRLEEAGLVREVSRIDAASAAKLELRRTLNGHTGGTSDVAFAPGGFLLASSGGGPSLRLMTTEQSTEEFMRGDSSVRLWRTSDGAPVATLDRDKGWAIAVDFSPDGSTLAAGYADGSVVLWDTSGGEAPKVIEADDRSVSEIAFSPDGKVVASSGYDGVTRLWSVAGDGPPEETMAISTGSASVLAFSSDGRLLVAATNEGAAVIDIATAERITRLRSAGDRRWRKRDVLTVALAPRGDLIAGADDAGLVSLWRAGGGDVEGVLFIRKPTPELDRVHCLAFPPTGDMLAVGYQSGFICFWQLSERRIVAKMRGARAGISALTFSPEGSMLASSSRDATVRIWGV